MKHSWILRFHMDIFSLPSKLLAKHNLPSDVEGLFVELNFRKSKWLLFGTYHLHKWSVFFNSILKALDTYGNYDNVLLAADFDAENDEPCLSTFLDQHDLYNFVKESTCFKNSSKATSIDLFLKIKSVHFKNTAACSSGIKTSFDERLIQGPQKKLTLNLLMKIYKLIYLQHNHM